MTPDQVALALAELTPINFSGRHPDAPVKPKARAGTSFPVSR
jgi:hypothetical protein